MGVFDLVQASATEKAPPCHQEVQASDVEEKPCDMCETATNTLDQNAIAVSEVTIKEITEISSDIIQKNPEFFINIPPLEGFYHSYSPPPQALLKAVTPNTKTVVILS